MNDLCHLCQQRSRDLRRIRRLPLVRLLLSSCTMKIARVLASFALLLAAAPAWADGAPPDDCTGKAANDSCYDFDAKLNGVCVADAAGLLSCQVLDAGTGGTGGTGTTTTTATGTGGGGSGGETESSGCSMRTARSLGGTEAAGLVAFGALCAALQRRRRR